jgi:hypothetical protein
MESISQDEKKEDIEIDLMVVQNDVKKGNFFNQRNDTNKYLFFIFQKQ